MIFVHRFLFRVILTELISLFPAIATVVTVAEILKNNGFAVEKSKNFDTPCTLYHGSAHYSFPCL
jgi:hypothetical protein